MLKNLLTSIIASALAFNAAANESKNMARQDIADKNLEILFNITTKNNKGSDKEFMDILQKYIFGEVFEVGDLDIKKRELLTVTTLTVLQTPQQLKAHVVGALNAGNTPVEIREAIYLCAPFIGFPKTLNAIAAFNEVVLEKGLENELKDASTVEESERYQKGSAIQKPLYGDEIKEMLSGIPGGMGGDAARFLTKVCFGDFYTREGLDVKTRELMTIAILTATGNTGTLKSHIKGNLKVGNSIETIAAAIIQVMPYVGFPNSFAALKTVKEVAEENPDFNPAFGMGEPNVNYAKYFIGNSYLKLLSDAQVHIANVTFEPKCRNNWHIHHGGGQILLVTDGRGYYQEWGKDARELKKGDVVNIPPETKHWHGAAKDSWFSHIAIEVPSENGSTQWLEEVSDIEYNKLK